MILNITILQPKKGLSFFYKHAKLFLPLQPAWKEIFAKHILKIEMLNNGAFSRILPLRLRNLNLYKI